MEECRGVRVRAKLPKGTRDYLPDQMRVREQVFDTIRRVFKRHGAVEIDTPVFELKETLTGKYGEDSKLIYELADQGGELLAMRYDLTVPFARFLAVHSVGNIKRYHIAKVYRRDSPAFSKGRYREFYQCDFDIAGSFPPLVADSEVLTVVCEILSELPIGPFLIKLNHRKLLDAIFGICGVPAEKFLSVCSAIDKLDKLPWCEVRRELIEVKGIADHVADKLGTFVVRKGDPVELHHQLMAEGVFEVEGFEFAYDPMQELLILFNYLQVMNVLQYVSFDLSLARGLDYYTGLIYEAVIVGAEGEGSSASSASSSSALPSSSFSPPSSSSSSSPPSSSASSAPSSSSSPSSPSVGSIAAGGRYDNLVGMFSSREIQCVGVSIGVERILALMESEGGRAGGQESGQANSQEANVNVFVASVGRNLLADRMAVCKQLWTNNISAEFSYQEHPKLKKQMDDVLRRCIPFMVIIGEDELAQGVVKVKNMTARTEHVVPLANVANFIASLIANSSVANS